MPAAGASPAKVAPFLTATNTPPPPGMRPIRRTWAATGWKAGYAWTPATWSAVGASMGLAASVQPVAYSYGNNITYQDDQVYYGSQPVGHGPAVLSAGFDVAQCVRRQTAQADDWMPLGVFAFVQKEQSDPHYVMQLAINKSGAIEGNYSDVVSGTNVPIQGAVDKKTQRAAWTVGKNEKHRVRNRNLQSNSRRIASAAPYWQGQNPAVASGPAETTATVKRGEVTLIN